MCRRQFTDIISPMENMDATSDDPPYDTIGNGTPATGASPMVMPTFNKA
jgi:hypothetical protein